MYAQAVFRIVASFAAAAILSGCTSTGRFVYDESNDKNSLVRFTEEAVKKRVAVLPFTDRRQLSRNDLIDETGTRVESVGSENMMLLGFVPLVPLGYVTSERPENSGDFITLGAYHFEVANDLSAAAALSLRHSKLFSKVTTSRSAEEAGKVDYLFIGELQKASYKGLLFSYGVTYFVAPALWLFGAPQGRSSNELELKFSLLERQSGRSLWSYNYRGTDSVNHFLYGEPGTDVSKFSALTREALNSALRDLSSKRALFK